MAWSFLVTAEKKIYYSENMTIPPEIAVHVLHEEISVYFGVQETIEVTVYFLCKEHGSK